MTQDVATLQAINDTLQKNPKASQRELADNAGMSIGLMNAVIKRFVERGWIMLSNVNLRKLSYAVTPAGIAELTERSQTFAKRTFAIANRYNDTLSLVDGRNKIFGRVMFAAVTFFSSKQPVDSKLRREMPNFSRFTLSPCIR